MQIAVFCAGEKSGQLMSIVINHVAYDGTSHTVKHDGTTRAAPQWVEWTHSLRTQSYYDANFDAKVGAMTTLDFQRLSITLGQHFVNLKSFANISITDSKIL